MINLNEYSNKVFEYLQKNNSKLLENVTFKPSDFGGNYIFIEFVTPNENSASNLMFYTEENRVTVGFDSYHCHFYSFEENDFQGEMKSALECFYKILNEEIFVFCAGGGATTLLTIDEISIIESGGILEKFNYECINFYVTSWSGKHDGTFKNPN